MAQTITVNGTNRSTVIQRDEVEWAESAFLGETASGSFTVDDAAGTIDIPSHKAVTVVQDSSTPTRIYSGFTRKKNIGRGDRYTSGASRRIRVATVDGNDLLRRLILRIVDDEDCIRPEESVTARVAWLLASPFLTGLVSDFGRIQPYAETVDGGDLRGRYPGDILADLAKVARFNHYVRWNEDEAAWELVFRDDNQTASDAYLALTDTCTLSISNVASDVNGTTVFAPQQEAELDMDGEHVYSGVRYGYRTGNVYRNHDNTGFTTDADFAERDGVSDNSEIESATNARREADTFLFEASTETQILPVKLRLRADKVGLVQAGQRIETRMTHLAVEGWDPARYARVLRKRVTQPLNTDNDYDLDLDLAPMEAGPVVGTCVSLYDPTPSDTYYPLGGSMVTLNPNPSDGVVFYWRAGYEYPGPLDAGLAGQWHFPIYGAGGSGTVDYAGDCSNNRLIFVLIGNGTAEIQTEAYPTGSRALRVYRTADAVTTLIQTGSSGDLFEVEIDDRTDGNCVSLIEIVDSGTICGGKWGFSEMVWTAA